MQINCSNDPNPFYPGVTLDRSLSYRQHLTKTAGKLQSRNNLLMKLAGSFWGANANTLRSPRWLSVTLWQNTVVQCGNVTQTTVEELANNCCHKSVEGRLAIGYGGQFQFSGRPHNPTSRF